MSISTVSLNVWEQKYRFVKSDGTPVDKSVDESWDRVARTLASVESDPAKWEAKFRTGLNDFKFLPAGRILAGVGTGRSVTLFNCFVMGTIPDDMAGIFDSLREAALTMQQGGGIGYDFSTLRPNGAPVHGVGADASGPLSFMDVWDAMCRTIMSAGSRRGAMMATLRCDHPDVEAFVDAKRDAQRLRMFNLSVLVTDAFMAAVDADGAWDLVFDGTVFRTIRARDLWHRIMQATYDSAEPGVIFIDRINDTNNLAYCETIQATNPCGEQPLPPYGACLLGSINLARFVEDPFGPAADIDLVSIANATWTAVRMMDNVVDVSQYPLEQQAHEARMKRRIGLGVTGLADALIMVGAHYDSPEAIAFTDRCLQTIQNAAYAASADLAAEKGPFPLYDREAFLERPMMARLDTAVVDAVATHGLRNGLLTSIAPTGTISLMADNVSSGIEPVFAQRYNRSILNPDGSRRTEEVKDYAYKLFRSLRGEDAELPPAFVDAQTLRPEAHVAIQAAAQKWVDSSISKTINCPADISFDAFQDVYRLAYRSGCKGCTTYRPNSITGSVLSVASDDPSAGSNEASHAVSDPISRPAALPGSTYKLKWPESDHAIYVTINDIVYEGQRRPFEVFINSKNMEHYAWTVALTRMISAVFRRGGDVSFVVEELKAVFDPRGGQWMNGRYVPSLLAAIGEVLESHMRDIGFLGPSETTPIAIKNGPIADPPSTAIVQTGIRQCPRCGAPALTRQEGCDTCMNCGYSRCA